jgi:DNA polymerase I-like protein with 3'-5' exonuclease and polymerase domains
MSRLIEGDLIAFDTETTGLYPWKGDKPFAFSFCNEKFETAYIEFEVNPFNRQPIVDHDALDLARKVLEDESVVKVMHNGKFDVRMCDMGYGIHLAGPGGRVSQGGDFEETMFAAHCCNSLEPTLKLKRLGDKYTPVSSADEKELKSCVTRLRKKAEKLGWMIKIEPRLKPEGEVKRKKDAEGPADYWIPYTLHRRHPELCSEYESTLCEKYAVFDAVRTMYLHILYRDLRERLDVNHTYQFEKTIWPIVYHMEYRGVHAFPDKLEDRMNDCIKARADLWKRIIAINDGPLNTGKYSDMYNYIYNICEIPFDERWMTKKSHKPSTGRKVMEMNRADERIDMVIKYKANGKAFDYFADYQRLSVPEGAGTILHPDFQQIGPKTGRFACRSPNIQQVTDISSATSLEPQDIRCVFGPRPGYVWFHNDYKGMEVNVYADCSQEPNMLRAIAEGREIHDEVTNRAWGGRGNERGLKECVHVLGLDGTDPGNNDDLVKLLRSWSITPGRKLPVQEAYDIADAWMRKFDWDIVKAQASIGKKVTKNKAKMVTFLKIYGGGVDGAMTLLKMSREETYDFLQHYNNTFPRIPEYQAELSEQAKLDGYVRTLYGRRLEVRRYKAYQAVNYVVQGTSADLLKAAMIKCSNHFHRNWLDAHIIMPVHDELAFEINRRDMTYRLANEICDFMEDTDGNINVPMKVDPSLVTERWSIKEKVTLDRKAWALRKAA